MSMKTKELIAKLSNLDPEAEVLINAPYGPNIKAIGEVHSGECVGCSAKIDDQRGFYIEDDDLVPDGPIITLM